jgi:signal transduction histidine kinase
MPEWWPHGESWPPHEAGRHRSRREHWLPIGIAMFFAVALHLIVLGALAVISVMALAFGFVWQPLWPVTATPIIVLVAGLFVVAMRRVGSPMSDIVAAAGRVADGDLSVRLDERGLPWLRSVSRAFNSMTVRLERQQRERRELMADIAHELRTPLSVIQGRVEGMLDDVYPRNDGQVSQLLEETRTLARLVEDLRTSAHAESGTLTLQKESTDLCVLIEEAVDAWRPDAGKRQIRIDVHVAADLPLLDVDALRIREVLVNLISNAVRHSPDGAVIRIHADKNTREVVVHVVDDGEGIAPPDLPRVFDRFYKGASSRGSGLGLSIARSLVRAHGGTIAAERHEGRGTTLSFTLPL